MNDKTHTLKHMYYENKINYTNLDSNVLENGKLSKRYNDSIIKQYIDDGMSYFDEIPEHKKRSMYMKLSH